MIINKNTEYSLNGYIVAVDESDTKKTYTIFDNNMIICEIDGVHAEKVADTLLEVIYDLEKDQINY